MAARAPVGRLVQAPVWRLLVHRQYEQLWRDLQETVGTESVQQFYDQMTQTPDRPPMVGTSGMLKGGQNKGKNGWSWRVHYEISGAGRIDYEYHPAYAGGAKGDRHPVVRILKIALATEQSNRACS